MEKITCPGQLPVGLEQWWKWRSKSKNGIFWHFFSKTPQKSNFHRTISWLRSFEPKFPALSNEPLFASIFHSLLFHILIWRRNIRFSKSVFCQNIVNVPWHLFCVKTQKLRIDIGYRLVYRNRPWVKSSIGRCSILCQNFAFYPVCHFGRSARSTPLSEHMVHWFCTWHVSWVRSQDFEFLFL